MLGVGFAAALVLVQLGLFFGLLENASVTIDKLGADLWITARNTQNVDFGNPYPEGYVQRVRSIPGVVRADNLIVWYAIVALPSVRRNRSCTTALKTSRPGVSRGMSSRATPPISGEDTT